MRRAFDTQIAAQIDVVDAVGCAAGNQRVCPPVIRQARRRDRDLSRCLSDCAEDRGGRTIVSSRRNPIEAGVAIVQREGKPVDQLASGEAEISGIDSQRLPTTSFGEAPFHEVRGGRRVPIFSPRNVVLVIPPYGPRFPAALGGENLEHDRTRLGVGIEPDVQCDQAVSRNHQRIAAGVPVILIDAVGRDVEAARSRIGLTRIISREPIQGVGRGPRDRPHREVVIKPGSLRGRNHVVVILTRTDELPMVGVGAWLGVCPYRREHQAGGEILATDANRRASGQMRPAVVGEVVGRDRDRGGCLVDRVGEGS